MVLNQGIKMSKSKGNTVDPQPLIERYGADTVRLFIIFAAPPEQSLEWSDSGVEGAFRFLKRLWALSYEHRDLIKQENLAAKHNKSTTLDWEKVDSSQRTILRQIYEILDDAKYDYERLQFNTVVSSCMKLFNLLAKVPPAESGRTDIRPYIIHKGLSILLRLLAPIAPHITHQLWQELGYEGIILNASWPKTSAAALKADQIDLVVQINGKLRSHIRVASDANEKIIQETATQDAKVQQTIANKLIKKIITVPGKLVNIVTEDK